MSGLLRDNWKWIVVPILVLVVGIVLVVVFAGNSHDSPFQYTDF